MRLRTRPPLLTYFVLVWLCAGTTEWLFQARSSIETPFSKYMQGIHATLLLHEGMHGSPGTLSYTV